MSYKHENPAACAVVQVSRSIYLLVVNHGHKEIWGDEHNGPTKITRRFPEDGKRVLVQLDRAANHVTIIVKMSVPTGVAEDDIRSAVRTMIIGVVKEPAEIGLNP